MALLKERGDSFTVGMSLAEMAFLIVFVLLLLTTFSGTEEGLTEEKPGGTGTSGTEEKPGGTGTSGTEEKPGGTGTSGTEEKPGGTGTSGTEEKPGGTGTSGTEEKPGGTGTSGDGRGPNPAPPPGEVVTTGGGQKGSIGGGGKSTLGTEEKPGGTGTSGGTEETPGPPSGRPDQPPPLSDPPGYGLQPCWRDADGKIEYLYKLVIHEDSYELESRWPAGRDAQAVEFMAKSLVGGEVDLDAFVDAATPIREWSDEQNPPCRHYFYVREQDVGNFGLLLRAEDFMYKFVERGSR